MTMGMGQQLLGTGFDNASFLCLPFRESLALRPGASPDICMAGTALGIFFIQGGYPLWLRGQGWTGGLVLSHWGYFLQTSVIFLVLAEPDTSLPMRQHICSTE